MPWMPCDPGEQGRVGLGNIGLVFAWTGWFRDGGGGGGQKDQVCLTAVQVFAWGGVGSGWVGLFLRGASPFRWCHETRVPSLIELLCSQMHTELKTLPSCKLPIRAGNESLYWTFTFGFRFSPTHPLYWVYLSLAADERPPELPLVLHPRVPVLLLLLTRQTFVFRNLKK